MLPDFEGEGLLLVCLALTPALVRLLRTRALSHLTDDPAVGERLIAAQRQNLIVVSTCTALAIVLSARSLLWWIPLAMLASLVAGFPQAPSSRFAPSSMAVCPPLPPQACWRRLPSSR